MCMATSLYISTCDGDYPSCYELKQAKETVKESLYYRQSQSFMNMEMLLVMTRLNNAIGDPQYPLYKKRCNLKVYQDKPYKHILSLICYFSICTHFFGILDNLLMDRVTDLASKKAAVIFTKSSCCMCHSIKALFYELGASPAIHEVDHDADMEWALQRLGCNPAIPAVFIGGKYVGSARDVISLHVDGSLKQKLIEARAIWF
ncbi:hypothetical protein L6452_38309 [Arctium lappa]|uniref:Uncharacterized protein n=1 Tax=Arctium lappa TaxID=4217 RepID=A0ACB8Y9N4_ARCLA|nr:hypothetical protein L6452_38309 [Arctium lappa]